MHTVNRVHGCPFGREPRNALKCLILQGLMALGKRKQVIVIHRKIAQLDEKVCSRAYSQLDNGFTKYQLLTTLTLSPMDL